MQALSLGVHIPLVCFGLAFPAMVLFTEWLYNRTGDPVYRTLAKRWSKVMLILFAVGVVTGTILSFELGLLWPGFMEQWGEVFGFAFAIEGLFFFCEAIFIAIYVYGWDRLPPRAHFLSGIPIAISGVGGSMSVIAVNGWMNNPQGFDLELERRGHGRAPIRGAVQPEPLARGGPHVPGGVHRRRGAGGLRVRGRVAARTARPLPPRRADHSARGRWRSRPPRSSSSATGQRAPSRRSSRSSSRRWRASTRPPREPASPWEASTSMAG